MFMMDEEENFSKARKRLESGDSDWGETGRIHWSSGSCNEQGRYKYNEDRCVHFSDVLGEFSRREADGSIGTFDPLPLCSGSVQSSVSNNASIGYFGVFDGHAGQDGSIFVSQNLHLDIIRYTVVLDS